MAGVAGAAAVTNIAEHNGLIPPDWGGVWGPGETLTYAVQRAITGDHAMAREFAAHQISKVAPVSGKPPVKGAYPGLAAGGFAAWRLVLDGMVANPATFSLAEL